jgi:hypothetical protein
MKKFILAVLMGLFSITAFSQEKLTFILETDFTSKWNESFDMWSEYNATRAHFDVYKDEGSGATTKIVAYLDAADNYSVGITFYVYRQIYENESHGQAFYFYAHTSNDFLTSRTYDKSVYIKIIDEIFDEVSNIELVGYQSDKLCWSVKNMIKK